MMSKAKIIIAVVAILLIAGAGGWLYFNKSKTPTQTNTPPPPNPTIIDQLKNDTTPREFSLDGIVKEVLKGNEIVLMTGGVENVNGQHQYTAQNETIIIPPTAPVSIVSTKNGQTTTKKASFSTIKAGMNLIIYTNQNPYQTEVPSMKLAADKVEIIQH